MKKLLLIIPMIIFLFSCGTSENAKSNTQDQSKEMSKDAQKKVDEQGSDLRKAEPSVSMQLNDIWALTAVNGNDLDFSDKSIYRPTLEIHLSKMIALGLTGCNNFQADMIVDPDRISFPPFPMTQKFCEGYEGIFVKGIVQTASYKLDGLILYFYDKDGMEVLRFKKVD